MNGNVPHAARVIRTVLATVRTEQAAAVAHALDSARLLVDPERSFGVVLYRTPDGGWSRTARPVTELERQALSWDTSCERARHVARAVERHLDSHPGPHDVRVEGDRLRVLLRVDGSAQWERWRSYFGIAVVGERTEPHTLTGEGERDGVGVTVVALSAPAAPPKVTTGEEKRPFRIGETLYDLALPQRDAYGGVWYFQGRRSSDGMPLMSLDGRPERCSLANVVAYLGTLSPVRADDDSPAPGPAGIPPAPPTPSAPPDTTDPAALPDVAVPSAVSRTHSAVSRTPSAVPGTPSAVPRTPPDVRGAWAMVDVSEAGVGADAPQPRAMPDPRPAPDPRNLRTIPSLPGPEREREPEPEPVSQSAPVEPTAPPPRPAWAEPFGPLVPSGPAAGPAGPA
ncbi:BN159_2729 family protein [Streptomyces sp. NBC_00289]|uniref:BN159_2729 family protein n=1 Tax=Streptomyces sp. NBC_00289 TaxID=2975703 RepID=UPI003246B48D